MIHSDDQGLVLPPRVAAVQVIIVPCGITASTSDKDRNALLDECQSYEQRLCKVGVKAKGDYRDNYSPGWKYNHWELKVPYNKGNKSRSTNLGLFIKRN